MNEQAMERYIRFSLSEDEYAIPLLKVREVIAMPEITPVPQTPSYFLGIINLRGQVITVIDLRVRLGLKAERGEEMAVIITDLGGSGVGIVVDSINSVLTPAAGEVSEKPNLAHNKAADYITGVYRKEKGLVLFLDINGLLSIEDQSAISASNRKAA